MARQPRRAQRGASLRLGPARQAQASTRTSPLAGGIADTRNYPGRYGRAMAALSSQPGADASERPDLHFGLFFRILVPLTEKRAEDASGE
jgi:hypothetical protein